MQVPQEMVGAEEDTFLQPLVELDRTVLQLVRQLRRKLNVEGSKVKLEIGHIEAVRVRGDEEVIRRIILILLDNALKYTPDNNGANPGRVTVSLERKDAQAVVSVHDTGIGIGPDDLPHIFERFYRKGWRAEGMLSFQKAVMVNCIRKGLGTNPSYLPAPRAGLLR